jgi:two-component system, NarL family, invasion response regulator UvrY
MIRVGIADDQHLLRQGVKRILENAHHIETVFEAETGWELLDELQRVECDVAIMDVSMPGPGFVETLGRLQRLHPTVGTLVLSMHPEESYGLRALKAGALGYLNKTVIPEELLRAVQAVAMGRRYLTHSFSEALVLGLLDDQERAQHESLSNREFEVLRLVGAGSTTAEIGQILSISPKTVHTYTARIKNKMGFASTAAAIRYALENDLVGD